MGHKVDRYQITFVLGDGEKGAKLDQILATQTKRIQKILDLPKPSQQEALRVALRMLAKSKDKDIDLVND